MSIWNIAMLSITLITATLIVYLCAGSYLLTLIIKQQALQQRWLFLLSGLAITLHGISLYPLLVTPVGLDLAINKVLSLIMFSINSIVLVSALKKPLHNLFILLFPLSVIAVILSSLPATTDTTLSHLNVGISLHVLLSIIAYSLLSTAVLQALLLHWQDSHLKKRQITGLIKHWPPLQTMESLMFELLWVGVILLAAGIIVGALYIEDMFAQHLAHKTLLSIVAWVIFATLLWGRVQWGWRGNKAIRWVLGGFCVLMLAYFGSKLVLEIILV